MPTQLLKVNDAHHHNVQQFPRSVSLSSLLCFLWCCCGSFLNPHQPLVLYGICCSDFYVLWHPVKLQIIQYRADNEEVQWKSSALHVLAWPSVHSSVHGAAAAEEVSLRLELRHSGPLPSTMQTVGRTGEGCLSSFQRSFLKICFSFER